MPDEERIRRDIRDYCLRNKLLTPLTDEEIIEHVRRLVALAHGVDERAVQLIEPRVGEDGTVYVRHMNIWPRTLG
jgi:hypothetical protein